MIKRFIRAIKEAAQGKPLAVRSSHWKTVREAQLRDNPTCAACGGTDHLQVHHILPFHLYRDLELDPNNLIVLCEDKDTKCHLHVGHRGNWKDYNPMAKEDAKVALSGKLSETRKLLS